MLTQFYLEAGARLHAKREAAGLSLRILAESAGVSFETVHQCDTGRAVHEVDTCERLAVALGVAPCWLGVGAENWRKYAAMAQLLCSLHGGYC